MAQALPPQSGAMDENNIHYTSDSDDSDDIETPHVSSHSPNKVKQNATNNHVKTLNKGDEDGQIGNGTAQVQPDRYGFIGGKEFTDPEQYVYFT